MILPDLNSTAIVWTDMTQVYANASPVCISTDIHAIQAWRERELELASIRKLGENWDGYGSEAPTDAVLDRATLFLRGVKDRDFENPPMRLALSPAGLLTIDWLDGKALVRAEIQDSDEIEWMRAIPGQPTEFVTKIFTNALGSRTEQVQMWQPAPTVEEEPDLACVR
jgi:hypothetical protein